MNSRMNLTGLADLANAQLANRGRPLQLALDDVVLDPDNPVDARDDRNTAAIEVQEQLDADVAARGVKTPISVRAHPSLPGKYLINYGRKRYASACKCKLATIPAFIDEDFDSYDQVNENELRIGLTTRARALFIKKRLDAGDSKAEIAERMRKKNQTFITEHLALIDAPDCVNDAYAAGITSARTLYDLRQAWQEFPAAIAAWCHGTAQISRDSIRDALVRFRHDEADSADDEQAVLETGHSTSTNSVGHGQNETPSPLTRQQQSEQSSRREATSAAHALPIGGIGVHYKGKPARIAANVMVPIVLGDSNDVLHVPLSELVFKR